MVLTLAPPHLWVKVVKQCRKSNARAIWSVVASGMLDGPGLLSHSGIRPALSVAPPSVRRHGGLAPVTTLKKGADRRGRPSHRPWRARAQPEERLARPAA